MVLVRSRKRVAALEPRKSHLGFRERQSGDAPTLPDSSSDSTFRNHGFSSGKIDSSKNTMLIKVRHSFVLCARITARVSADREWPLPVLRSLKGTSFDTFIVAWMNCNLLSLVTQLSADLLVLLVEVFDLDKVVSLTRARERQIWQSVCREMEEERKVTCAPKRGE